MKNAKMQIESKDSMDKYEFLTSSIEEMDDNNVTCWRIWVNNVHIHGNIITLTRGVCYVKDSKTDSMASFNLEDLKSLQFNVDDPFKIYKFEFED